MTWHAADVVEPRADDVDALTKRDALRIFSPPRRLIQALEQVVDVHRVLTLVLPFWFEALLPCILPNNRRLVRLALRMHCGTLLRLSGRWQERLRRPHVDNCADGAVRSGA